MSKAKTRGNGQGTAFKRGQTWTAQITSVTQKDENGKIIERRYKSKGGFKTKREALAYCETLRGQPIGINQSVTFTELYKLWSGQHFTKITNDTKNCYTAAYAHCTTIHNTQFVQLKTADLQTVVDACELGNRTKQNMKALFTCMYKYAIENDYLEKNYAEFVKLPKREKSKKAAFTAEDRKKLWEAYETGNNFIGYILVMIYTGMRYGEISTALVANIHLDQQYLIAGIKTDAGRDRVIPLHKRIIPVIKKLCGPEKEILLDMPEKKFYNQFSDALKYTEVTQLPPHSCRHTCATTLAEEGVQPALIQQILGHTDYQTTLGYTHIDVSHMIDAINKID